MSRLIGSRRMLTTIAVAALASLSFAAIALAASKTKTFSAGQFTKGIPDNSIAIKTLNVKKKGKIKDLNVTLALSTNENDDFDFYLISPGGKGVQLSTGNGGSGSGYGGNGVLDCADPADTVIFDDEAATNIEDYQADTVFQGSYRPEGRFDQTGQNGLNSFDGKQLKGKWKLVVGDNEEFGAGSLQCFKLKANYKPQK